jgi:hypothetical protein
MYQRKVGYQLFPALLVCVVVSMLQFVCMGGTPKRMEQFAYYIMEEIGHKLPAGTMLQDISQFSYRYSMYKVGPVLSISVSICCLYMLAVVSGGLDTACLASLHNYSLHFQLIQRQK